MTAFAEEGAPDPGIPGSGAPSWVGEAADALFGQHLPQARAYAQMLATDGVVRGLIGPREAPRIWERHLLNCAAVAELIPAGASVIDVGSGAGLPGLVLAVARPDLTVTLVDSMARRTDFLTEAVTRLGLDDRVAVRRGRAEECAGRLPTADVVTARALAPLDRLAAWCLPLTSVGGRVLAMKGDSAAEEIAAHAAAVRRAGGAAPVLRRCGVGVIDPPTIVVEIVSELAAGASARRDRGATPRRGGRARRR